MKKVLIAIDYNPCAQKIAETGYAFSKTMNAAVCITHAIADITHYSLDYSPVMGFGGFEADSLFKNLQEQEKEAAEFLEAAVKHLGDSSIKTKILDGRTADAILDFASLYGADVVVMGNQSHSGLEKLLVGSVVAEVLKHTAIPVLIVPTDRQDIIFASKNLEALQYV